MMGRLGVGMVQSLARMERMWIRLGVCLPEGGSISAAATKYFPDAALRVGADRL